MKTTATLAFCRGNEAGSAASSGSGAGQKLYTLAQLQAAGKETAQRLKDVGSTIQRELEDLSDRIPVVVRAIWGKHSEAVVDALKQQQALATRLIRQWEMAEHRLIAVANSLSVSSSGQVRCLHLCDWWAWSLCAKTLGSVVHFVFYWKQKPLQASVY